MNDLVKTIDHIRHERFRPLYQSLKSHIELSYNSSLHISPGVLKEIGKRLQQIESDMLELITKEEQCLGQS
jgi:iron-sulfur cluster repair protein YtfE (RIC family)